MWNTFPTSKPGVGKLQRMPIFINSFIGIQPHSFMYCLWLLSCYSGQLEYSWQRPHGLQSLFHSLSLYRKSLLTSGLTFLFATSSPTLGSFQSVRWELFYFQLWLSFSIFSYFYFFPENSFPFPFCNFLSGCWSFMYYYWQDIVFVLTEDCTNSGNVTIVSESCWLRADTITKAACTFYITDHWGKGNRSRAEEEQQRETRDRKALKTRVHTLRHLLWLPAEGLVALFPSIITSSQKTIPLICLIQVSQRPR